MIAACPSCSAKFRVDDSKIGPKGVKLRCTKCQTVFPVMPPSEAAPAPAPAAKPAPAPAAAPPPPAPAPAPQGKTDSAKIMVAHDSHSFCKKTEEILRGAGYSILVAHDADEALEIAKVEGLDLIILDVMLPGMLGFEVASKLRNDPGTSYIKIILAASIFDPSAYKRSADSHHGADDIIESHHLDDQLLEKVQRVLSGAEAPAPSAQPKAAAPSAPSAPAPAPAAPPAPSAPAVDKDSPDHLKAQRLARTIVSDIALYNADRFAEGLKNGNIRHLLEKDIREGNELYNKRVSQDIRSATSYLEDALNALFERKKTELGL